jgi:formylglycine-generating enzyme required for sulfatase activity
MKLFYLIIFCAFGFSSIANNLVFKNGQMDDSIVHIEISWENAWNLVSSGGNFDAVWIFLKGRSANGQWVHIDIETDVSKHFANGTLQLEPASDGKGIFVYKIDYGVGQIEPTQISISTSAPLNSFNEVKFFGIEMVHIPSGAFYAGDGASISSFAKPDGLPWLIDSEDEIDLSDVHIYNPNTQFEPTPLPDVLPELFPKGVKSFYVMKYEVSQLQYVDFLNTLTYNQQVNRTASPPSSPKGTFTMINPNQPDSLYRNGVVIVESGVPNSKPAVYGIDFNRNGLANDESDGLHRAANFLNWADLGAYLDWAALRPITELEFEKICRGSGVNPVKGELAWGTANVTNANSPVNDGTIFEMVSDVPESERGLANHGNFIATQGWGLRGVLRNGFAAKQNSSRLEAGAAYFGVMEMSGNVWEQTIMVGGGGEFFNGSFGDGVLDENGNANQETWCNPNTASGVLLKGGGWASTISDVGSWRDLAISDRFYSHLKPSMRRNTFGGRGGR